MMQAITHN